MMLQGLDLSTLDDTPLGQLYQREAYTIFKYIYRRVTSREDAEDILLEVFLAALENEDLADLKADKQRAWLFRVAHNKVIDHRRYATYRTAVPLENIVDTMYETEEAAPDELLLHEEEYQQLQANLARLPALQQEIVHMRFHMGMRYTEIARRINKREGAVRTLLSRSLSFLRNIYKQ